MTLGLSGQDHVRIDNVKLLSRMFQVFIFINQILDLNVMKLDTEVNIQNFKKYNFV